MITSQQERKKLYQNLPSEIQEFVSSEENIEVIQSIAKSHNLPETLSDVFDAEVYNTMIGAQTLIEMTANLKTQLGLPEQEIAAIVSELNNQILLKLENLKNAPDVEPLDHVISTPTDLMSDDSSSHNLPEVVTPEESIMPLVGTPGEKLAWEQRKQKLSELETPKSNYGTVDPYREPTQ